MQAWFNAQQTPLQTAFVQQAFWGHRGLGSLPVIGSGAQQTPLQTTPEGHPVVVVDVVEVVVDVVVDVVVEVVVDVVVVVVGAMHAPLTSEVPAGQRQRQWPLG